MIKTLLAILLAIPLASFAPVPSPVYRVRFAVATAPAQQECTFETATSRLRQEISDPIGYPFGNVTAFSCAGDGLAVARELAQRAATMQAEATTYRASHPIGGATPSP